MGGGGDHGLWDVTIKEEKQREKICVLYSGVTVVPNGMFQSSRICKGGGVCLSGW